MIGREIEEHIKASRGDDVLLHYSADTTMANLQIPVSYFLFCVIAVIVLKEDQTSTGVDGATLDFGMKNCNRENCQRATLSTTEPAPTALVGIFVCRLNEQGFPSTLLSTVSGKLQWRPGVGDFSVVLPHTLLVVLHSPFQAQDHAKLQLAFSRISHRPIIRVLQP